MAVAACLVALGVGYLVYLQANKNKEGNGVRLLGQVIGIFIMIAALLMGACSAAKSAHRYGGYGYGKKSCSYHGAYHKDKFCSYKNKSQ